MNRGIVFFAVILIVASVVTVVAINTLRTPRVTNSDLVICGTRIVYGGSIAYYTNETTATVYVSGNFFPEETVTSTFTTNVTFSATPGYSTSISDLGNCTFAKT